LQQPAPENTVPSIISFNPRTEVVIVFPDGYYQEKKNTEVIPAVEHTLVKNTVQAPVSPSTECRKKENLPLAGIIPDEAEPIAAVATGVAVTGVALGTATMGPGIASFFDKLSTLVKKLLGQKALKKVSDTLEIKNKTETVPQPAWIFGFTRREILVLGAGILILTFAFLIAKRVPWDPVMVLVFLVMAGSALVIHEVTHAMFSRKYKSPSEFKFWGLGSLFLFVGGWLFGTLFSQPYLTVAGSTTNPLDLRNRAIVKVSGPVISLLIAILCFYMIPFARGLLATTLTVGFSINLLVCVYSLIPVSPLDGKDVYAWNRVAWGVLFVPLLILYLIVNM
jgi:Zn-dependent protease